MTFEEAIADKENRFPSGNVDFEGDRLEIFIAPADFEERILFRKFIQDNYPNIKDEDAIQFSNKKVYCIIGIHIKDFSLKLL